MRVLFFVNGLGAGGKERRLLELLKGALTRGDIECCVVLMDENVHYREVFDLGIDIHFLLRRSRMDPGIFSKFYRLCSHWRPDIIHSFDAMTMTYALPVKLFHPNIKLVNGMICDAPAYIPPFSRKGVLSLLTFPLSDVIVANSYAGLVSYDAPKRKSMCIHNGFDFSRTARLESRSVLREKLDIRTPFVVGMVASFSPAKDHQSFFTAAELLLAEREDITFVTVGDGDLRAAYEARYWEQPLIRFLGKRTDVEAIIQLFDIGVLSTFTEGIPNSVLEYMSLRKPVIATDGGGTAELVADGRTGYLVAPRSPARIADKIAYLLEHQGEAVEMGMKGRERIERFFSIGSMVSRYYTLYHNLYQDTLPDYGEENTVGGQ